MRRRRHLQVIEPYEVIGQPVVSSTRLSYVPWIDQAVRPYRATRIPSGVVTGLAGLADALRASIATEPPSFV